MTEKMELAFDVQKISIFMLMINVNPLPGVAGLIIGNTTATSCDGSRANITFAIDLESGTIPSGSEFWYYEATQIAGRPAGVFTPKGNYISRLHNYSTYGLALDNITAADGGRYLFEFSYHSPTPQGFQTATATLTVKVAPTDSCIPSYTQSGDLAICELGPAANCGSPRLVPMWINTTGNNFTVTKGGTYTCCANGTILMDCYRGSSNFCKTFQVAVTTPSTPAAATTTERETTQTLEATSLVTKSKTDNNGTDSQQLYVIIGASVGSSVFLAIIAIVVFVIRGRYKGTESRKEQKDKKNGTELEQSKHNQAANRHDKVKDENPNPPYQVSDVSSECCISDIVPSSTSQDWNDSFQEEHEVTKSNPNKEMSKVQMQPGTDSSYQTSASL